MTTLLSRASTAELITDPFPYLVIKNALPEDYYKALEEAYPSDKEIGGKILKNNTRYQLSIKDVYKLPKIWQDFMFLHTSPEFYKEVVDLFSDSWQPRLDYLKQSNVYRRNFERPAHKNDVSLDCQIGINSPVTESNSVKSAHVDNMVELFAGLFYMRQEHDDSVGGDLDLYKPKDPDINIIHKKEMDLDLLHKVDTVKYEANTFVIFLCSKYSIHGVTPRSVTPVSRRLVNVIGELTTGAMW